MRAPDFTLPTERGESWSLSEQRGKVVTLLFYPGNETLQCTRQLCSVRDNWTDYLKTKAVVVGVSPGKVAEHQQFSNRHDLPLPLLADADREVTDLYCYHSLLPSRLIRAVFVVDAKGIVRSRDAMLRAFRPSDEKVLAAINAARVDSIYENYIHV